MSPSLSLTLRFIALVVGFSGTAVAKLDAAGAVTGAAK